MAKFTLEGGRLSVNGALDWASEEEFEFHSSALLESEAKELQLDLSGIDYLFSPFIGRIVKLHANAVDRGLHVRITISPKFKDLFDTAGLTEALDVHVAEE